ncbi:hypothetical protein Tco_0300231 [Tanacetum coccineum]
MDDEPIWDADRVVVLTSGSIITIPKTTNEFAIKAKFDRFADKKSGRPSGSLLSNTQPNPNGSSSKTYQPPQARNEHVNAIFTRSGKSYDPTTNLNDQQNDSEAPINFDTFSCNALADLGASINLMPYSLYEKLSLETLKLTKMGIIPKNLLDRVSQLH